MLTGEARQQLTHQCSLAGETENRYTYTIEPTGLDQRNGQTILSATLAGNFPGSPVDLTYEFTIGVDDAIQALRIYP